MFKQIKNIFLVGLLSGQLISLSCTHTATIKRPEYGPLAQGQPLSPQALNKIKESSPKDAVFADLLQAFALMRTADIESPAVQKEISGLLTTSVSTFEDMTDPVNFSKAFSADESKAFRGRPHERMYASLMAGVFMLAQGQNNVAEAYFRNAESLEAHFQKMPFGTDAPLAYALMYWSLHQRKGDPSELKRAADGVLRSVRFLSLQEPLVKGLVDIAAVDLRPMALANRLAYMIFEISIYHSLISAPNNLSTDQLIDDAAKNAEIFTSALGSHFEDEYKNRMEPIINELARVYGRNSKEGQKQLKDLAFGQLGHDVKDIGENMKKVFAEYQPLRKEIEAASQASAQLTEKILASARLDKLILNFTGTGPTLERQGSYDEISVVKPGPDANPHAAIRERNIPTNTACGFHRTNEGNFSAVLCGKGASQVEEKHIEVLPSLELLSLSRKATTAGGRKFDQVLKGRAQFRAATEDIATIGAWSAFFLFYMGTSIMNDCNRRGQGQACYAAGFALWGIAGLTVLFSGTIWLIGRSSNPAADSRFIHLMYESAWLAI